MVELEVDFKSRKPEPVHPAGLRSINMTIGELAEVSGIPASTLRYWERIKVLPRAHRVSGQRRYQTEAKYLVAVLRLAKHAGSRFPKCAGW
jgi:hypothetical protein